MLGSLRPGGIVGQAPCLRGRVLVSDTFTRANNASSLGNAETGQAWTALAGTWGVSGNRAYVSASPSNALAVVDAGAANGVVRCTFSVVLGSVRLVARATDTGNYLFAQAVSGNYGLYRGMGGVFSQLGGSVAGAADGDVVELVLAGSFITLRVNGASIITATETHNQTATKHGLGHNAGSVNGSRWDNFRVTR